MKRQIGILMAAWLITSAFLRADTSYLLIQGPFGPAGSTVTYKWQVNYPTGYLVTGQDLLDAVFGNPVADGTVANDPIFGGLDYYISGDSKLGASYASYGPGSYLALSYKVHSINVETNDSTPAGTSTVGWNYYVAGGTGDGAIYTPPSSYSYGAYPDGGGWTFSNDGTGTRFLSNGSYDGWVYGNTGSDVDFTPTGSAATIDNTTKSDDPSDFSTNGAHDVPLVVNVTTEGRYTILLSSTETNPAIPQGMGYATMMVSRKGGVVAAGKLPDGENFTTSGMIVTGSAGTELTIDKALSYPSVTTNAKGSLSGRLTFAMRTGLSNFNGTLQWMKPKQTKGAYPAAIDTSLSVVGSIYERPGSSGSVLPGFTTGTLELSDTSGVILSGSSRLTADNNLKITSPADKLNVRINPANGMIRGGFDYPGDKGKRTYFDGVLFQDQAIGGGTFIGPKGGGTLSLEP